MLIYLFATFTVLKPLLDNFFQNLVKRKYSLLYIIIIFESTIVYYEELNLLLLTFSHYLKFCKQKYKYKFFVLSILVWRLIHTHQCSESIPDSVLRNHSWKCSQKHMGYWGSNLVWGNGSTCLLSLMLLNKNF